jgi:hypothetical protein
MVGLVLARPTHASLCIASVFLMAGVALRIWALCYIKKDKELCTQGPYSLVRHPLYVGNFIVTMGVLIAGNSPVLLFVFVPLVLYYVPLIRAEEHALRERFGAGYDDYAARVPAFVPSLSLSLGASHIALGPHRFSARRIVREVALASLLIGAMVAKEDLAGLVRHTGYAYLWTLPVVRLLLG